MFYGVLFRTKWDKRKYIQECPYSFHFTVMLAQYFAVILVSESFKKLDVKHCVPCQTDRAALSGQTAALGVNLPGVLSPALTTRDFPVSHDKAWQDPRHCSSVPPDARKRGNAQPRAGGRGDHLSWSFTLWC